jgi:hypothetical protein
VQTLLRRHTKPLRSEETGQILTESSARRIDVNNINMFVTNLGSWANDFANQNNSGLFYPKGTTKTAVYESGLWIGARVGAGVNRKSLATIAEYSQEFGPGQMVGTSFDDPSKPEYMVYKMVRFTGDPADTGHVERNATAVAADRTLDPIAHHSWSEYMAGAATHGAPWQYYTLPDPNGSGTVQVPGPTVSGDQMLWAVYNDADASRHQNKAGKSAPLGIEVQQKTFAFDRQGALGGTVFLEFKMINKGGQQLDSMFVSLWADPDLGGAGDDLVGCDTLKSLGYVYNATNTDQIYADRPPAVGYDFFQGPKVGATTLGLASFDFYINGKDPQNAAQSYNLMLGLNADGTTVDAPPGANPAFYASGDPVAGTGWLDSNPADRRFLMSAGPFSMAAGDTQIVVGAIVVAQGGDRLSSVTGMEFFDTKAQKAFDIDFQLPPPPPQPKVAFSTGHGTVNLSWDSGSRFNYTPDPGYVFEGYVVYQGASISGPWKRLRVFDVIDGIKDVRDSVFDVSTGLIVHDTPTAFGGDNGVQYTYSLTQDQIRGGDLRDGQKYYYAVTAYAVNLDPPVGLDKVLETSFRPVAVVVQRPASGTDVSVAYVNGDVDHQADTEQPKTTEHVVVSIVDPASITGHEYAITFQGAGGKPHGARSALDSTTPWSLLDLTAGTTLLSGQTERTNSPSYAPVDGMVVKLLEQQSAGGPLNDIYYTPFRSENPYHGVGAGLTTFEDSFGYSFDFFNGIDYTDPANAGAFPNVELRFGQTQKGYIWFRDELASGSAPSHGRGYWYGGMVDMPFQAWDIDHNRQLEVGFVERRTTTDAGIPTSGPATHDLAWAPPNDPSGLGREYLGISSYTYTGTAQAPLNVDGAFQNDGGWLYSAWLYATGKPKAGDKFVIVAAPTGNVVATSNDTLRFTTSGPLKNQVALQKAGLDKIRVVPNPYYAHSTYELSSLNRVVKFINLPETATIRIYNLAGDLVQTLHKTDQSSSLLEWDLLTTNRLPVASGVYVYHIEVPGAGSTTGKMVIFMEKERLSNL